MRSIHFFAFLSFIILSVGFIANVMLKYLNRVWWNKKLIRLSATFLPLFGVAMMFAFAFGEYNKIGWMTYPGALLSVSAFLVELALMLALPFSGLLHLGSHVIDYTMKKRGKPEKRVDSVRRDFLKISAAAFPLVAVSQSVSGVAGSFSEANVYKRKVKFESLPPDLDGFKILHLSDIHLGHYVGLDDLSSVLTRAEQFSPDLILVTGDIADYLKLLPDALSMIDDFKAPYGAYACLGNHEYFRGIKTVHRHFGNSPIPLLVNQGLSLTVGDATLAISGIDDPVRMGAKDYSFFKGAIDRALATSPKHDFMIMMSHRPDALDYASEAGINLTLAGHTHGGQLGMGGKSLFESMWPDRYLWGDYRLRDSHLYTSSGVGHWFPFRLGCPTEAPVIELVKN